MTFDQFWDTTRPNVCRDSAELIWNAAIATSARQCLAEKGSQESKAGKDATERCSNRISSLAVISD